MASIGRLAHRSRYRVAQFRRALGARPAPDGLALVAAYLSVDERRLFDATSPRDQHHHIRTLELLRARAPGGRPISPDLARAALLHDIGKGRIRLFERVAFVLLMAAAPALLRRLTRRAGPGPLGALYRMRHHAAIGTAALQRLGVSARTLALVARHHEPPDPRRDPELAALIAADEDA